MQGHCHQKSVLGTDADTDLIARTGLDADLLDSGCCGLAGNFGFERGHYDVSMACAERVLLPAVRAATQVAGVKRCTSPTAKIDLPTGWLLRPLDSAR